MPLFFEMATRSYENFEKRLSLFLPTCAFLSTQLFSTYLNVLAEMRTNKDHNQFLLLNLVKLLLARRRG